MNQGWEDDGLSKERTEQLSSAQLHTTQSNDASFAHSLDTPLINTASAPLHGFHSLHPKPEDIQTGGDVNVQNQVSSGHSRRTSEALQLSDSLRRTSNNLRQEKDAHSSPSNPSFRRYSSSVNSPAATKSVPAAVPLLAPENVTPVTSASVAAEHFQKDLAQHGAWDAHKSDTIVIIHDSCYGHRYSRPKTSKSTLNLIVERPERIQAAVLGVSSAYVRLGGRYTGARAPPHLQLEPSGNIPFHIKKTTRSVPLTTSVVTSVHGAKWMQELKSMCDSAEAKLASRGKELSRAELTFGVNPPLPRAELHEGDLYLCKESLDAFQGALGGVLDGVDAVFQESVAGTGHKRAFVCIRPPGHHCSSDYPSGFCWLNNVHVGIEHAAQAHGLTHAAIIDFDLHHGDGSQAIAWERNSKAMKMPKNTPLTRKTSIGYFSLHDVNSYPCEYEDTEKIRNASVCIDNAHGQSIWNVHLQPWKDVSEFWDLYRSRYLVLLDQARAFIRNHTKRLKSFAGTVKPKAAIFLSAGFDASEWESEGMQRHKVNVPTEFYMRFTADVVKLAEEEGTGVDGRIISVLEGGYSNRALMSGILSHLTGLVGAQESSMPSSWWTSATLAELEDLIRPQMPPAAPKKTRTTEPPTYTSSTQSFTAKMVDPSKTYRSISGTLLTPPKTRPATPPSPDVDWATAAHELSKLLIPTDRRIESCKHEELSEPRFKRERKSSTGLPLGEPTGDRMQLRGRKAKVASYADPDSDLDNPPTRAVSNSNRRRTIADMPVIVDKASAGLIDEIIPYVGRNQQNQPPFANASAKSSNVDANRIFPARKARPSTAVRNAEGVGIQLSKTRRASVAKADVEASKPSKPPPVPRLPTNSTKKSVDKKQSPVSSKADTDIDSLTSGINKITIKTSQDSTRKKPNAGIKPPTKPAQKPSPFRAFQALTIKASAAKTVAETIPSAAAIDISLPVMESTRIDPHNPSGIIVAMPVEPEAEYHDTKASTLSDSMHGVKPVVEAAPDFETSTAELHTPSDLDNGNVPGSPSEWTLESHVNSLAHEAIESCLDLTPANLSDTTDTNTGSGEFIHYIPSGPSQSAFKHNSIKHEPLTWLPPNTSTPVPKPLTRGRADLPTFTAEGFIPFAAKQSNSVNGGADVVIQTARVKGEEAASQRIEEIEKAVLEANGDVGNIPETPSVDVMLLD